MRALSRRGMGEEPWHRKESQTQGRTVPRHPRNRAVCDVDAGRGRKWSFKARLGGSDLKSQV